MSLDVRPRANLPAALLVAGAVAVTPVVVPAVHQAAPAISTVAVRPASVITDVLNNFGDLVDVGANAVVGGSLAVGFLPALTIATGAVALQQPGLGPSAFSSLIQGYFNPEHSNFTGFASYFLTNVGLQFVKLLPAPLGPSGVDPGLVGAALKNAALTIGGLFNGLPDPAAGDAAISQFFLNNPQIPSSLMYAASAVIPMAIKVVTDTVSWAAHLPGTLEATVESAIRDPGQIPGLLSNLVSGQHGLVSLFTNVLNDLATPLAALPAPFGPLGANGEVAKFVQSVLTSVQNFVATLPTPVTPKPFAAVAPVAAQAPIAPAASQAPIAPVAAQAPVAPVPSQLPVGAGPRHTPVAAVSTGKVAVAAKPKPVASTTVADPSPANGTTTAQ